MELEKQIIQKKGKVLALDRLRDTDYALLSVYRYSSMTSSMPRTLYLPAHYLGQKSTCGTHTLQIKHFNLYHHFPMNSALFTTLHS